MQRLLLKRLAASQAKSGKPDLGRAPSQALKALESDCEPVAVGAVLSTARKVQRASVEPFQSFEHRTIVLGQQPVGDMQPVIGINTDQMRVNGRMMNLGEGNAIGHHWLTEQLILVRNDMSSVQ